MKKNLSQVRTLHIRRALENSGLSLEKQQSLYAAMVPNDVTNLRLKREQIERIVDALRKDRKCGLMLTDTGKLYVVSAANVKFTNFNFQNEEIRKRALEVRLGGVLQS